MARDMSTILVNFDVVYDLDLAMIKLLKNKYNNPELIKEDIINSPINTIKMMLESRAEINPLTIALKNDVVKYADDYLLQFSVLEKETIYTKDDDCLCEYLVAFIDMMMDSPYYNSLIVYCKNELESKLAKMIFPKCSIITTKPDYTEYGNIFIKDSNDLKDIYGELAEHTIVIIDALYNMKEIRTKEGKSLYDYKYSFMHILDQIATIRKIRQHSYQLKEDSKEDSINENSEQN